MLTEIVKFRPKNAAEDPNTVLEDAKGQYEKVFLIGWNKEGYMQPMCSENMNAQELNWMLDVIKLGLLNGDYFKDED